MGAEYSARPLVNARDNLAGCVRSQAIRVERFIALGGGVAQESVRTRPCLWKSESAFPRLVIQLSQQKAGKVGQF